MLQYSHLITVEGTSDGYRIRVDRVFEDGRIDFCINIDLPTYVSGREWDAFDQVATHLGKYICIDSSGVRDHFGIDRAAEEHDRASRGGTED